MTTFDPNLDALRTVAHALGPLRDEVLFVGGATAGLLITDPAAVSIRPTVDVDCVVEIASTAAYHAFERRLLAQGFCPDSAVICRYRIEGVTLDVMPTDASILGFANRWAGEAFGARERRDIGGLHINVITAPYFVATKLEAFHGRGGGDFLSSHDLEDIVAVLDGRPELLREVADNPTNDLRAYLGAQFRDLVANPRFVEALTGHLPPDPASQRRLPMLRETLRKLGGS